MDDAAEGFNAVVDDAEKQVVLPGSTGILDPDVAASAQKDTSAPSPATTLPVANAQLVPVIPSDAKSASLVEETKFLSQAASGV